MPPVPEQTCSAPDQDALIQKAPALAARPLHLCRPLHSTGLTNSAGQLHQPSSSTCMCVKLVSELMTSSHVTKTSLSRSFAKELLEVSCEALEVPNDRIICTAAMVRGL